MHDRHACFFLADSLLVGAGFYFVKQPLAEVERSGLAQKIGANDGARGRPVTLGRLNNHFSHMFTIYKKNTKKRAR
jgi:hypothetical protein